MYGCPLSSIGSESLTNGLPECAFIPNAASLSATAHMADPASVAHQDSRCAPAGLSSYSPRYFILCTPRIYHLVVCANLTPICPTRKETFHMFFTSLARYAILQGLLLNFSQWDFQEPHAHLLSDVPLMLCTFMLHPFPVKWHAMQGMHYAWIIANEPLRNL